MAKGEKEKELFVVQDRRKFTSEGELRPESEDLPEETTPRGGATVEQVTEPAPAAAGEMPLPPTSEQQQAQHGAYDAANAKIDSMLDEAGAKRPSDMEVSFERLIASLYMQAMMQLGMIREENAPMQPDVIGARQTIDTIALLKDKTRGNLEQREQHMLENCLFELRMAYIEITRAITSAPPKPGAK